ncbi:DNA integrity scanning protein DisA [Nocardia otitidiscaviarum]|uniref:DNA integrity scanning protein DisA n=1 Tax=Nocardia otitidiscaviarum TaxID=1823 RepID=A0A516NTC3_9NOCA|nr:DNA integrity scanning diadenylate cyclase DisA [Nocardia otitidiscaviarum]MBF6134234.1 DNA integrity scanning protein DisA [Nocardia otitidiscaviarum]MBF6484104.1 DNA integrity scanning protein DisA [Nocardia otitidiscaviarum]MCP9621486.1 DNA integrity scanning diadenylate cyclase DisA [Nocardia otitidiscaviarum]QDP82166.1 DNA integrity scanning protein DisA [Nocardia otitidiscaviarum]
MAGRWVSGLLGRSNSAAAGDGSAASANDGAARDNSANARRDVLSRFVPGTQLRDGIDRILRGRTGGLIVLGYDDRVERICDGGFELDVEFAPTRLRELSKMDGAVVLSTDGTRIVRANVHLVPDPALPTVESGTRHKAAERTAAHTGYPVVSVSRSTGLVTVYAHGDRYLVEDSPLILSRANQAMATLQRYRARLDEVTRRLSALEIEDFATLRDVLTVLHCLELMRRTAGEIDQAVAELGVDGRQLALQLTELVADTAQLRRLLVRDYLVAERAGEPRIDRALARLDALGEPELLVLADLAPPLGYPATLEALDTPVGPRGYRLLAEIPRVPFRRVEPLVDAFGGLRGLLDATQADLETVDGITPATARRIREGLSRHAAGGDC